VTGRLAQADAPEAHAGPPGSLDCPELRPLSSRGIHLHLNVSLDQLAAILRNYTGDGMP
jgi:hypothetical protein